MRERERECVRDRMGADFEIVVVSELGEKIPLNGEDGEATIEIAQTTGKYFTFFI